MYAKYAGELQAIQTMRPRLLRHRRDELVIYCVRHPAVCAEAKLILKPEHFNLPDEKPHQMLIRHLWKLITTGGYTPGRVPYEVLFNELADEIAALKPSDQEAPWIGELLDDPDEPGWEHVPPGLLRRAYRADPAGIDVKYAFETLKLFLEERDVVDAVASLVAASIGARVPLDHTRKIVEIVRRARRIEAIGSDPFELPMPEDWAPTPLIAFPTGAHWVDHRLDGQVAGDVNGLMGVFGGGKTTGLTQLATGTARYFFRSAAEAGTKPKLALLISYEERLEMIRPRVMSCAARISKTRLEQMKSLDDLSRRGKLENYEIGLYREEGKEDYSNLDGEYERFMAARGWLNQSLRIVDMRDEGRGYGWIDELSGFIARLQEEREVEVGMVCIDYVNAMVRRHIDTLDRVTDRTMRELIQKTPLQVEEHIARRFHCPVWLAQQFSGEANKKSPTAKMVLADASEARSFGENLVFCVAFGVTDPKTKCVQATYVKARRKGVQGESDLLRLEGDLGRLVPVDHIYTVEGGKIIEKRLKQQFEGPIAVKKHPFLIEEPGGTISQWQGFA